MNKLILSIVIAVLSFGVQAEKFDIIVKWKNHADYLAAFDTPKQRLVKASKLKKSVNKESANLYSTSPVPQINDFSGLALDHIRSGANRTDSYAVEAESFKALQHALMATGYFEYISLNASYQGNPITDEVLVNSKRLNTAKSSIAKHSQSIENKAFNDPYFTEQVIFQPQGRYTMGSGSFLDAMNYVSKNTNNTKKIRVAVLDTGKWEHEDITWSSDEANMVSGKSGAQCLSNDETNSGKDSICPLADYAIGTRHNNAIAKSWVFTFDSDNNPISDGEVAVRGHGLAVASMIAAKNNNGLGITAPNDDDTVELVPVRVFGTSTALESDIVDGIYWASGMSVPGVDDISSPVDIINMSIGGNDVNGCNDAKQEAINYAVNLGITVVIAAGNSSLDTQNTSMACDNILSVGAHTLSGEITSFSNYGELVDVTMLGETVMAASITTSLYTGTATPRTVEIGCGREDGTIAGLTGCYWTTTGTSIATPLASALVAQLKKVRPEISPAEVRAIIKSTALNYDENEIGQETLRKKLLPNAGAGSAYNAVASTISNEQIKSGKVEHQFSGIISEDEVFYLTAMIDIIGKETACNSYQASFGYFDAPVENIHYEIFQSNSQDVELTTMNAEYMPEVDGTLLESPSTVVNMSGATRLGVRACYVGNCGEIFEFDLSQAQKPVYCSQ